MTSTTSTSATGATTDGHRGSWTWPADRPWTLFASTAALYAMGSFVALIMLRESGLSGVFFIPAGVTVGLLLRTERRHWWLVILGVIAAETSMDLLWGFEPREVGFYVAANSIEPLVGAAIVSAKVRSLDMSQIRHLGWFLLGAVIAGPAIGAAIGALGPAVAGTADFGTVFTQWWLGDAVGVVVVGGLILAWGSTPDRLGLASPAGAGLILGLIAITSAVLSRSDTELMFLVMIGVVIAGAVFGTRAVAISAAVVSATVAVHLLFARLTFAGTMDPVSALMLLKMKIGTYAMTGYLVAAAQSERTRAEQRATRDRLASLFLQEGLLPKLDVHYPGIDVAAKYEAASDQMLAGGDWYDVYKLPDGRIGLTVGDVIGHGLEAAVSMGKLRAAVAALARHASNPGELLSFLDVVASGPDGTRFATAVCATLDPESGTLEFASAGHLPMLISSPGSEPALITGGLSAPLSNMWDGVRDHETIRVPDEGMVVLYSDGLVEKRGETIQAGLDRLLASIAALHEEDAATVCEGIFAAMGVAEQRHDDVVVLVLKRRAVETEVQDLKTVAARSHAEALVVDDPAGTLSQ